MNRAENSHSTGVRFWNAARPITAMLRHMREHLSGLMPCISLLVIVEMCIKFWVRRTITGIATAVNVNGDVPPSEEGHTHTQGGHTDPQRASRWSASVKVTGRKTIAKAEREPFAEAFFELERVRNGTQEELQLNLVHVEVGVGNCCSGSCSASNQQCNKNCKTVFVHELTIEASPKPWAQDCRPHQASLSYQPGNTVSRAFGWISACRDAASSSVFWILKLNRYADGSMLKFNCPRWGPRPLLGINPSLMQLNTRSSFLAGASWELSPNAEFHPQWPEWDVKINLGIAVQSKRSRRLTGYVTTPVPTVTFDIPMQFS